MVPNAIDPDCTEQEALFELGPSYISIFDQDWVLQKKIQVNGGDDAFRVMVKTLDDDIYVVYDEVDKNGGTTASHAKIEHYKITKKSK